ncbi:MAG: hypothetical protein K8T89_04485 [Planctomycetes bacterium]|nr:hypothetical protein [Planctomycetota bacterium]
MFDAKTQERLREIFRRENRSFLQYIHQASPWSSDGDRGLVEKVNQLATEELEALEKFATWIDAKQVPLPYLGAFPTNFTSYNFVAIRKLLPPLILEQRKELADLEADALAMPDAEVQKQLASILELNRKHLLDFEQMTQPLAA